MVIDQIELEIRAADAEEIPSVTARGLALMALLLAAGLGVVATRGRWR